VPNNNDDDNNDNGNEFAESKQRGSVAAATEAALRVEDEFGSKCWGIFS